MKNYNVESFDLDNTKVDAPYIRSAGFIRGKNGDCIYKYDVRFKQPNIEHMDMPGLHSIEHLMAHHLRDHLSGIVDVSPMGCQTGFYITILNNDSWNEFANAFSKALEDVINADEVPACNITQCGWAANHSLEEAKKIAYDMLKEKAKWSKIFK